MSDSNETTVSVEWGHKVTWPDGYVEYNRDKDRARAASSADSYNRFTETYGKAATVQTRTVTTSPWTEH